MKKRSLQGRTTLAVPHLVSPVKVRQEAFLHYTGNTASTRCSVTSSKIFRVVSPHTVSAVSSSLYTRVFRYLQGRLGQIR
jgi:hypothetical protein